MKTLALRMERHCASALELARWLEQQPLVKRVHYPGLRVASAARSSRVRQMHGFGGMISLELATDLAGTRRFLEAVRIFALAESLGGVESLIEHPAIMTHATIPAETRATLGIGDSLVRLSVGDRGRRGPARRPAPGPGADLGSAARGGPRRRPSARAASGRSGRETPG